MRALAIAPEEARRLGSVYVGTEHLFIALLRDDAGVPAAAIEALGVRTESVLDAAEKRVRPSTSFEVVDRPFASSLKRTLELALVETAEGGEQLVRPEHLLVGLLRAARNAAADVLEDHGITLARARASVAKMRGREPTDPAA
jgi:ATP-dependent Clp protease ATP-binding subunit ClpC